MKINESERLSRLLKNLAYLADLRYVKRICRDDSLRFNGKDTIVVRACKQNKNYPPILERIEAELALLGLDYAVSQTESEAQCECTIEFA